MAAESPGFQFFDDGQSVGDDERESAYRAGWCEALAKAEPDFILEDVETAEKERWALKQSIYRRYGLGEDIGRADQLAIDKARGRHQLLAFIVDEAMSVEGADTMPEDQWNAQAAVAIAGWKNKTEKWIGKGYMQPAPDKDFAAASIENCIMGAPGFIREYIEHHGKTAHRQQPRFALAGALSLVGVLCGRKVRDPLDARSNIYSICVAGPASGKDRARKLNVSILAEAGATALLGADEATSDSAIGRMLKEHPARLMQIDEIGRWLAGSDAAKNPATYRIITAVLKLWSEVTSRHWSPLSYADISRNYAIDQPHLCILGTTTPEVFYNSLGGSSVDDGLLSRVNIFIGNDKAERSKPKLCKPPQKLIDFAAYWYKFWSDGNTQTEHPEPAVIATNDEAEELYEAFAERCDTLAVQQPPMASLWGRCYQKARQFGLIYAIAAAEPGEPPLVDGWAARWGINLAISLTAELCELAESRLSRSQFEKDCQEILRAIRSADNGIVTKQQLCRALRRLKAREQRECIEALIDQERIGEGLQGKSHIYFCAERQPGFFQEFKENRGKKK